MKNKIGLLLVTISVMNLTITPWLSAATPKNEAGSQVPLSTIAETINGFQNSSNVLAVLRLANFGKEADEFQKLFERHAPAFKLHLPTISSQGNQLTLSGLPHPVSIVKANPLTVSYEGNTWVYQQNKSREENHKSLTRFLSSHSTASFGLPFIATAYADGSSAGEIAGFILMFGLILEVPLWPLIAAAAVMGGLTYLENARAAELPIAPQAFTCPKTGNDEMTLSTAGASSSSAVVRFQRGRPINISMKQSGKETVYFLRENRGKWEVTGLQQVGKSVESPLKHALSGEQQVLIASLQDLRKTCSDPQKLAVVQKNLAELQRQNNSGTSAVSSDSHPATAGSAR